MERYEPWTPGDLRGNPRHKAYLLGCAEGREGKPRCAPSAWPTLKDDYDSGWLAGSVAREQARARRAA